MPCPFCGIIILEENVFVVAGGGVHEVNLVGHRHFVVFAGEVVVNDASERFTILIESRNDRPPGVEVDAGAEAQAVSSEVGCDSTKGRTLEKT